MTQHPAHDSPHSQKTGRRCTIMTPSGKAPVIMYMQELQEKAGTGCCSRATRCWTDDTPIGSKRVWRSGPPEQQA